MAVYRYRLDLVNLTEVARKVAGTAPTLSAASPNFVDLTYTNTKADLDEYMATKGFAYVSTDPVDTPTAAVGALIGSSAFDMRDVLVWDHFIAGSQSTERLGMMGWQVLVSGTGSDMLLSSEAGHPGFVDIGVGSTAAGRGTIYLGDTANLNFALNSTQNQLDAEWLVRVNSTALSSTNNERFVIGFGDSWDAAAGVEQANGIYCEFNPSASANFRLVTMAASSATRTASNIAVAAATWYRIGLQMTYPGGVPTAKLFINGTLKATHTATIPTLGIGPGIRMDANAGTEPRFQLDYVLVKQVTNKET